MGGHYARPEGMGFKPCKNIIVFTQFSLILTLYVELISWEIFLPISEEEFA